VLERLSAIGDKIARVRRRFGADEREENRLPQLVQAAIENLRDVATKRLDNDRDAEARIVEVLARAAQELRNKP
jgi:hypothetical protein